MVRSFGLLFPLLVDLTRTDSFPPALHPPPPHAAAGFLCPLSANTYGIDFLEFEIKDYDSGESIFHVSELSSLFCLPGARVDRYKWWTLTCPSSACPI